MGFGCSLPVTACKNTFYVALFIVFNNFSITGTDSLLSLALETYATIPPNVDATLDISAHSCILLQNLNYLNCT